MDAWSDIGTRIKWHAWARDADVSAGLVRDLAVASGLPEAWAAGLLPALAALVDANTGRESGQSTRLFGVGAGAAAASQSNGELVRRGVTVAHEIHAAWPGSTAALPLARALLFWTADHPRLRQGEAAADHVRRAVTATPPRPAGDAGARFARFVRLLGTSEDLGAREVAAVLAVLAP